ncbi:Paf1-domain-containing protein [Mycena filopes]|nr:Paf1-domain-containing protein [Mycena filopes]
MNSVNGMFRVLDLISEIGSGGLVNKIIIAQDSLKAFINELSPGAYSSLTKVDFKALDELLIKPAGLYGSKSEIVASQEPKHIISAPIDVSREAQLRDIEASFAACNDNFALETLRHPNKPNVTAVESYEVLPDKDIWANQYDLFRFSERPGERGIDVDDPRLDCAILRPMKTEHDSFLAYYLTADDASAMKFKQTRLGLAPYEVPSEPEPTVFNFVRDYETVKVEQEVPNEFMLVIEDETAPDAAIPKTKGAYYKNIERKMLLKKKRVQAYDEYQDKWEIIRMTHVEMGEEEEAERNDLLAEVENPRFLREDVDADGDVELEDAGPIVVNG